MQTPSDDKVNEQPADDQRTQQLPLHATDVLDTGSDAKNSSSKIVEHAIDSYIYRCFTPFDDYYATISHFIPIVAVDRFFEKMKNCYHH